MVKIGLFDVDVVKMDAGDCKGLRTMTLSKEFILIYKIVQEYLNVPYLVLISLGNFVPTAALNRICYCNVTPLAYIFCSTYIDILLIYVYFDYFFNKQFLPHCIQILDVKKT